MGFFIDIVGLKLSFVICVVIWGLVIMGYVFIGMWFGLVFMCVLMGFSEALVILVGVKIVLIWFLVKECGVVIGVFNMGILFGVMFVLLLIVWCIMFYSW